MALPPRCPGCATIVESDHVLCTDCWQSLTFLTSEGCVRCGMPLADENQICAPCLADPPDHDGVRAAVAYTDTARRIVLRLKHGRHIGLAVTIARALARFLPGANDTATVLVVPVPLHRWRIWSRGFNQSALIAKALATLGDVDVAIDVLNRIKATPMLRGRGARERTETVRGAFRVDPKSLALVRGKSILLIDDVYTSGATTNACARVLKRAGARSVIILCWARVLRETDLGN